MLAVHRSEDPLYQRFPRILALVVVPLGCLCIPNPFQSKQDAIKAALEQR